MSAENSVNVPGKLRGGLQILGAVTSLTLENQIVPYYDVAINNNQVENAALTLAAVLLTASALELARRGYRNLFTVNENPVISQRKAIVYNPSNPGQGETRP